MPNGTPALIAMEPGADAVRCAGSGLEGTHRADSLVDDQHDSEPTSPMTAAAVHALLIDRRLPTFTRSAIARTTREPVTTARSIITLWHLEGAELSQYVAWTTLSHV